MPLLPSQYPNLIGEGYEETSPQTNRYNCIAWAAEDTTRWWWPHPQASWPSNAPRDVTVAAFIATFATLGFETCETPSLEEGYKKIAIYARAGMPTHAARQLPSGRWTSKIGKNVDIEHTLEGLEGPFYGTVVAFMKKPL